MSPTFVGGFLSNIVASFTSYFKSIWVFCVFLEFFCFTVFLAYTTRVTFWTFTARTSLVSVVADCTNGLADVGVDGDGDEQDEEDVRGTD